MRNDWVSLVVLAAIAAGTWLFVSRMSGGGRGGASMVGQKAPEISAGAWLNTAAGAAPTLAELTARNKVTVVEFWATWCPPCRQVIPHLVELHESAGSRGLAIVSLTSEGTDKLAAVTAFVKREKMPYIIGVASTTGNDYGVTGIPHAAVIDRTGTVVWDGHPMDKGFTDAVEAELARK